ncbi:MAG TPA: LuxR C-terminal-related transcriptional regulator [Thermomicrobiales bacterium]|nr:LuxR C-terminal-related transcriptional regulator [Thermomicrobiales bacterium]
MPRSASSESSPEELPRIFPLPNERHAESGALPTPRTSFVGREREVGLVQELLRRSEVRLVTLTGPGGVGKTRTAMRAVSAVPHSVQFVDLADVQLPDLVLPTIAAALGVRPDGRPVLDNLRAVLRDGDDLLVLDNFEQVLPAAAALADLLDACSNIKLLVTSRAVLGIPGEHVVRIRPFPLPSEPAAGAETQAADCDAVRLFLDRAQALEPEFALTGANAPTIVSICQRLDGLPLAIELAAAWAPVLSPSALLAQLEHRLALPGGGSPSAPQRQRSLRDTIAWSYGLLSAPPRTLFRRVAVFHGGCSLDAVQAICGDDSLDVLPELRALVANSLVRRADGPAGDSRYTLLETVREFGGERLEQSDEANLIRQRHAAYFLELAERAEAKLNTTEREAWLDRLEADQGNLHAALGWALAQEDAEIALGLCGSLLPFWQFRFHSGVGREWARRALALDKDASAAAMRKAVFCAGTLAYMHGAHVEAASHFADALARSEAADDPGMTGRVEVALGRLAWDDGDLDTARGWFEAAKRRFAACHDEVGLAHGLHGLGLVAYKAGDFPQAETFLRDALTMWQALGFRWELARCIPGHLADVAREAGNLNDALRLYQECLSLNWAAQDLENVSWSLAGLAIVLASEGQVDQAVRLMGLADRFEELTGAPLTPHIRRDHDLAVRMLMDRVGAERFATIQASVRSAELADEIDAALALTRREPAPNAPAPSNLGLTQRERDVLRMLAAGKSNQDIADELFVSLGTVKVHVTHILGKVGVKSRAAAADYAHRHGLA